MARRCGTRLGLPPKRRFRSSPRSLRGRLCWSLPVQLIMRGFALLAAAALFSTAALGQATGDVTGRVADSDGNPIVGAQVSLQPGSRRVLSDEAGRFEFRSVAAGRVTI